MSGVSSKNGGWAINPICKVLIGFKNSTTHATRSPYLSFPLKNEPEISKLLLLISTRQMTNEKLAGFSKCVIDQLIGYKFLLPKDQLSFVQRVKHRWNLLNENRKTELSYEGVTYVISSFCFMAFYKQDQGEYIKEKIILPFWLKKFSHLVYEMLINDSVNNSIDKINRQLKNKLIKYGLILPAKDVEGMASFFSRNCMLSSELIEVLPPHYSCHVPMSVECFESFEINDSLEFLDSEADLLSSIKEPLIDKNWLLSVKPSVSVVDPVSQVQSYYWLSPQQLALLKQLVKSEITIAELDVNFIRLLNMCRIIYTAVQMEQWNASWADKIQATKLQLDENSCIQFDEVLLPINFAIMRLYLRYMDDNKYLIKDKGNGNIKGRYWVHRDPFVFYLQAQLKVIMNQISPSPVKVGHNALTVYEQGADLPIHKDDVLAFSWVFSIPIETSPYKDREAAWPLHVDTGKEKLAANLRSGDGFFINPQMEHWRDELPDHKLSIIFCWFVPQEFTGYLNGHWT